MPGKKETDFGEKVSFGFSSGARRRDRDPHLFMAEKKKGLAQKGHKPPSKKRHPHSYVARRKKKNGCDV